MRIIWHSYVTIGKPEVTLKAVCQLHLSPSMFLAVPEIQFCDFEILWATLVIARYLIGMPSFNPHGKFM